jgi:hypothetical protein
VIRPTSEPPLHRLPVFPVRMHVPPVTGFTVQAIVDSYLALNEVTIHVDMILRVHRERVNQSISGVAPPTVAGGWPTWR